MTAALAVLAGLVTAIGTLAPASAGVSPGETLLVSIDDQGKPVEAASLGPPVISGNGRYVVFASRGHLDEDVAFNDAAQVYVRDLVDGRTEQLTVYETINDGDPPELVLFPGEGDSLNPVISHDGRFVAVQTTATMGERFPSDRSKVLLIDRDRDGDGQFDEPNEQGNLDLGMQVVSDVRDEGSPTRAFTPSMSDDGRVIVYVETPSEGPSWLRFTELDDGDNGQLEIVRRRTVFPQQPRLVLSAAWAPAVSGDGTTITASAHYDDPPPVIGIAPAVAASVPGEAVIAFPVSGVDPETGSVAATRLDVDSTGRPFGSHQGGNRPQISDDGKLVVFEMSAPDCPGVCGPEPDLVPRAFVVRTDPGGDGTIGPDTAIETLSLDNDGDPVRAIMPAISGDGRFAAFVTDAPQTHNGVDPEPGDFSCATPRGGGLFALAQSQTDCQVVVRDLGQDKARAGADLPRLPGELASPSVERSCVTALPPSDTCPANGYSSVPSLSDDGGIVAFLSGADDLIADDDNTDDDVFARRFTPTVQADPVDFGGVQIGDVATATTEITPVGFGPLVIGSVTVDGVEFELGPHTCGVRLYAGDSCAVSVDFTPTAEGTKTGTITVTTRGEPGVIPVTGLGTPFPQPDPAFVADPKPLDFGERLTLSDSAPGVVTVRNGGPRPLLIGAVELPPLLAPSAPGDYRITADTCSGAVLTEGGTCTVTLVHRPLAPGDRPAILQFEQVTPMGVQPHLVQLLGRGATPVVQVNPAVVPVGRLVTVFGTGFPPNQPITVTLPGFPERVDATTGADGSFNRSLVVYPNSVPGSRVVDATVAGPAGPITDTENLLVVPGSMGPPDFLGRR